MSGQDNQDASQNIVLSLGEVAALAERIFLACDTSPENAAALIEIIVTAERDGLRSHGLAMLPSYASNLRSGWADGRAVPRWEQTAPGAIQVDGRNGFAQPALKLCSAALVDLARENGIALLAIRDTHHIAALRPDIEPLADQGLVALTMVNARPFMVPWGGERAIFGTNPMAFAAPRPDGPPIVWDQASSVMAISEVRDAAVHGQRLSEPAGLDAAGQPTDDPRVIMQTEQVMPFAKHKGTAIALMVEILAGALTGACLGVEDRSRDFPGAASGKDGQLIIAIDPDRLQGRDFAARMAPLVAAFEDNGQARIPGDGRFARRARTEAEGVRVEPALLARLETLAVDAPQS